MFLILQRKYEYISENKTFARRGCMYVVVRHWTPIWRILSFSPWSALCVVFSCSYTESFTCKGKVVPVLNKLTTTQRRRTGEWMYRSTYSWPQHYFEVSGQLYPRGKSPWYRLDRRLGWPQNRSRWRGEEKNLALTGTRTPTPLLSSQSLHWLSYPGSQPSLVPKLKPCEWEECHAPFPHVWEHTLEVTESTPQVPPPQKLIPCPKWAHVRKVNTDHTWRH
jgi:hypothetical protein